MLRLHQYGWNKWRVNQKSSRGKFGKIPNWGVGRCETLNNTERNNEFYQKPCWAGRKDWQGMWVRQQRDEINKPCFSSEGFHFKQSLFPASACIKISGHEGERSLVLVWPVWLPVLQWTTRVPVSLSGTPETPSALLLLLLRFDFCYIS